MRVRCTSNHAWFYQWDLDQRLMLEECPSGIEVQYASVSDGTDRTFVADPYELDGCTYADVPNILLQHAGNINVYVCDVAGHTLYAKLIRVLPKEKPDDYVYTETEVKNYETLAARIDEIEKNGVSDQQIATAVEKYLDENPVDSGINFEPGNALELTDDGILNVKTTDDAEEDNTLPITSSGVHTIVGNIGAILDVI